MIHQWKGKYPPKYKLGEMLKHKYRPEIQGTVKSITYDSNFQTYRYDIGIMTANESFLEKATATK